MGLLFKPDLEICFQFRLFTDFVGCNSIQGAMAFDGNVFLTVGID
jgi:hypothetical protein